MLHGPPSFHFQQWDDVIYLEVTAFSHSSGSSASPFAKSPCAFLTRREYLFWQSLSKQVLCVSWVLKKYLLSE